MTPPERPPAIAPEACPACGTEMLFSGTQSAGFAQFFCEVCQYRHDRFVGAGVGAESTSDGRRRSGDD